MELCTGGELFDLLYDQPDCKFNEPQCAKLATKMLGAVNYLHSMDICHRDLKLENFIFENEKGDSEIKLIDFGLSKVYLDGTTMSSVLAAASARSRLPAPDEGVSNGSPSGGRRLSTSH